ncbi:tetratricopeptide repeat protein [Nocardia terpenica]|uniref:tetratricopeptide repeat protein n=1 Tax=Nocardia terpenica TaxID=455432 RepID=UPI000AD3A4D9
MGEQGPVRRLPVDKKNAGPPTESWIRYEKQAAALGLIRELLQQSDIEAIALQHSSDIVLLYRDRRPKLVSIKHREPDQKSGDSGWSRPKLKEMLGILYRQWLEAEQACQLAFWSNAGFVGDARDDHARLIDGAAPSADFLHWLTRTVGVAPEDTGAFARDLELLAEPLPRRFDIDAVGAAAVAEFLRRHGRDFAPLFARECFDLLCNRIIELSAASPAPPSTDTRRELVDRLYPHLDADDAARLASRTLPVMEAEAIVLREHDRRLASRVPDPGFGWEADDRFVGRAAALSQLTDFLEPGAVSAVVPVCVSGMTGCGKTSVATQFAALHADTLRPVFISASSRADVVAGLQQLRQTGDGPRSGDIADARTAVTPAMPATTSLLLILDGVVDADTLRGLIPRRSLCRVLITTTVANLDSGYREVRLHAWEPDESRAFLADHLPHETAEDRDRLRADLYDNPLALNQAVDHCHVLRRSVTSYLTRLREAPAHTLALGKATGHPASIIESIRINIEAVESTSPEALTLLTVLAFMGPAPLHDSVFDAASPTTSVHAPTAAVDTEATDRWWSRFRRKPPHTHSEPIPRATEFAVEIRKKLHDKNFRDRATENLARISLLTTSADHLSVHPLIALAILDRVADAAPWLEAGISVLLPTSTGGSITDPIPNLDENLSAAIHITISALDRGYTGAGPITMAALLCHRLSLVGANEASADHGWTATELGEFATSNAINHANITAAPSWKLAAARMQLPLAQAYSLAGRVDEALDAIDLSLTWGHELRNPLLIAEAVTAAEPIVTMHGRRDSAELLLSRIEELSDMEFNVHFAVQISTTQARILRMLNRTQDAAALCDRTLDRISGHSEQLSPLLVVNAYSAAAIIARDLGTTLSSFKFAMAIVELQNRPDIAPYFPPRARIDHLHLAGDAAISAGRFKQAHELMAEARKLAAEYGFDSTSIVFADTLAIEGRLAHVMGDLDQARANLEQAITILKAMPASFRPRLPAPLMNLAIVLQELGEDAEALRYVHEAQNVDSEIYTRDHPESKQDQLLLNALTGSVDTSTDSAESHSLLSVLTASGRSASTPAGDGKVAIDIIQVQRNIHDGLWAIGTDPGREWNISDLIADEELYFLFYKIPFGATIISTTLTSVRELLIERFGPQRAALRIRESFDIDTISAHQIHVSREAHAIAIALINATLADGAGAEPDCSPLKGHDDPDLLTQIWFVIVVAFAFINVILHGGE